MQGMDGLGVIRRINNIVKVPIILMSSDYLPVEPDVCKAYGCKCCNFKDN